LDEPPRQRLAPFSFFIPQGAEAADRTTMPLLNPEESYKWRAGKGRERERTDTAYWLFRPSFSLLLVAP